MDHFMIDVHTHLTDVVFKEDISEVIERAEMSNVKAALVMTESLKDFSPVLELYKKYQKFVVPCFGIHPIQPTSDVDENGKPICRSVVKEDFETAEELISKHVNVLGAVGEIGLDFTPRFCKTEEDKETQKWVFVQQIQLAEKLNLPVNVHSRSAGRHAIALLKELGATKVLLHAFDGKASTALEGVGCGFYFSVTAAICRDPQERNEPKNIILSCEYIARIKKMSEAEVKRITMENALKVFPRLKDYCFDTSGAHV